MRAISKQVAKKLAHLGKAEEEDERDPVASIDWTPVAKAAQVELTDVAKDGAKRALVAIGIDESDAITEQVFTDAVTWAKARSAELVGKRWVDDELVDSADAEMTILESTRDEIRDAVAQALEDGDSAAELADTIEGLGAFSEERAMLIARTEIIRANANGQMAAMRSSGVVTKKAWSTSTEDSVCDECQANEDQGSIDLDEDFESGDDCPPAHPACMCVPVAVIEDATAADTEEDDDESADEAAE